MAINSELDFAGIQKKYLANNLVIIDSFLSTEALEALERFAHEATIWNSVKSSGDYMGAYLQDGFTPRILAQVARELETSLPLVFDHGRHSLNMAWGYKYDSYGSKQNTQKGIQLHVDSAAVNANFWLTDDDANLAGEGGGLDVFLLEPPVGTPSSVLNDENMNHTALREQLETEGEKVRVSFRKNRLVLFKSNLWHATDAALNFANGYTKRRINLTLLFGQRESSLCHPHGSFGDSVIKEKTVSDVEEEEMTRTTDLA